MKRLFPMLALLCAAVPFSAGRAAPTGCAIAPGPSDVAAGCSYTAAGPGTYVAAVRSYWSITVTRTDASGKKTVVFLDEADADDLPIPLDLPSEAGDLVELYEDPACPTPAPCGAYGLFAAYERHP